MIIAAINTCIHNDAVITPPCCNGNDCACNGRHSVYCPNSDCTGITQNQADELVGDYIAERE